MTIFLRGILVFAILLLYSMDMFCIDSVEIKGYYQEDETFAKQRVIDPVLQNDEVLPSLSHNIQKRKKEIEKYYQGRLISAKISFPASYGGNIIDINDLGKSNVLMFKNVKKYGVSIEKDSKAMITKFKIKADSIDIEFNDGGYGNAKDKILRVFTGIISLGLTELKDYNKIRYQHGSSVRIVVKKKDYFNISSFDLNFEKFKTALQNDNKFNSLILENLNMPKQELDFLTIDEILPVLNDILLMPDFYNKVNVSELYLPKEINRLYKKVSAKGKTLKEEEIKELNRGILCSLYPYGIIRSSRKFSEEDLNFQRMSKYLSMLFEVVR